MSRKAILNLLLVFEIIAMFFAGIVFSLIRPKMLAALFAGGLFVVLGLAIVGVGLWRTDLRRTLMFPVGLVHLFLISIPMLGLRIYHYGIEFSEIHIWGLPGPIFHHVSEVIYLILMISTLVDRLRENKKAGL